MIALDFIVKTLFELYILAFLLRFLLQWARADFNNPLSQFIIQVTNPLVRPLRRFVPGFRGLDLSTLIIAYILQIAATSASLLIMSRGFGNAGVLLFWSLIDLVLLFLRLFTYLIIGQVLLSWFAPYHPASTVLRSLTSPVLRPIQKIVPPIANIDLSPLFALLLIQALVLLIRSNL